jgi:DNA-binding transcriptional LysR family regulator
MDKRQLSYFVAVAEAKSFTLAAAALNISQPPLTLHIQRLERELGVSLYERTTRSVKLTPAGEVLLADGDGRTVLRRFSNLSDAVRRAADGHSGRLILGFVEAAVYGVLPSVTSAFLSQYAGVELSFVELTSPQPFDALEKGAIQLGFVRQPPPAGFGYTALRISRDRVVVVMPRSHRLARRRRPVDLAELAAEQFVMIGRDAEPGLHDAMTSACEGAGFSMHIAQRTNQLYTVLALVHQGLGIALAARSVTSVIRQDVAVLELNTASALTLDVYAVWREDALTPSARNFLAFLQAQMC